MKTFLVIVFTIFASCYTRSQVIEDFEPITMHIMLGGVNDQSYVSLIANPVPSGVNISPYVGKLYRDMNGVPWCGFWAPLSTPIDLTNNKYIHVKVWKPRISPARFKIEVGSAGNLEIESMNPQTLINEWEALVFDFSSRTGIYNQVVFMPDYMNPVGLTYDITLFFDDIYLNNDPAPGSAPVQVIENFESITMNTILGGSNDNSFFSLSANPMPGGINPSPNVGLYYRDKDGLPRGGFWSALPLPIDLTDNKYIHVKIFKPRISPLHFKIEGAVTDTLEMPSTMPQQKINAWEDMVFDFSSKTGIYPTIAFMPDFIDPVGLTDDIVIYFDDIKLNNDPSPNAVRVVEINVDTRNSGLISGEPVFISGDFGGIWGVWNEPGTNGNNQMFDPDNDSIYSITLYLLDNVYAFKFFKGTGWIGGEWPGDPNRIVTINSDNIINCVWGLYGFVNTKEKMHPFGVSVYPNPFGDYLTFQSDSDITTATILSLSGQELVKYENLRHGQSKVGPISLTEGMYMVNCILKTGERKVFKVIRSK
ncbi:MAG: T9SS type A sorting domain-containing protein [Bacteroidota bacterium]